MASELEPGQRGWRSWLGMVTPLFALAGLCIYVLLSISYRSFFGALGLDPRDIGLTYVAVLSNSVGLVVAALLPMAIGVLYELLFTIVGVSFLLGSITRLRPHHLVRRLSFNRTLLVFSLFYFSALTLTLGTSPTTYADAVKRGDPILPATLGPLETFIVRADPVKLNAVDPSKSQTFSSSQQALLYLGQANGAAVLYDSATQAVQVVPSSTVVLSISNCQASSSPDPRCSRALRLVGPPLWMVLTASLVIIVGSIVRFVLSFVSTPSARWIQSDTNGHKEEEPSRKDPEIP